MAKTAAWRGDMTWVCANEDWRYVASYGLTSKTPLQGWAWEFLRRNSAYRASVDSCDDIAAKKWGLVELVDYRQAFARIEESSRPKWLALQAFEVLHGPQELPSLVDKQFALIFDQRYTVRKDVLQRQLAEFVEHLYKPTEITWFGVSSARNHGGRNYNTDSLLTYLRFADAVAQDRNIDSEPLKKALGFTSQRAGKQLHETYVKARSLVVNDYSRLVDLDLAPLKSIASPLRGKKPVAKKATTTASWD
jgi:hypothetical protein